MDEPEIPLTNEDWNAACEALRCFPSLADENTRPGVEWRLAELHRQWGSEKFQLRFGIREPVNEGEQIEQQLFRGEISEEEFQQRRDVYVNRPVDAEMLRGFFGELRTRLECYTRYMLAVTELLFNPGRRHVSEAEEAAVDRIANELGANFELPWQEIVTVDEFLKEARIAYQMGNVRAGRFSYPTASELVIAVARYAHTSWLTTRKTTSSRKAQRDNVCISSTTTLYTLNYYNDLPQSQELLTLLEQEAALARVCLRERQSKLSVDDSDNDEPESTSSAPVLIVTQWSDLAIGIDESWRYWAITPAPDRAALIKKSQAVELELRGKRWKAVLGTLADSSEPNQVRFMDMLRALDRLPPGPTSNAMDLAQNDQLLAIVGGLRKSLNEDLKDLARELRAQVNGPRGRGHSALALDGDRVISRFHVAYLMPDVSGSLRFGAVSRA